MLDATELAKLERSFRAWAESSSRRDVRTSRKRILLIFLIIRYTGARLREVLELDLREQVDTARKVISYGRTGNLREGTCRVVDISEELTREIMNALRDPEFMNMRPMVLKTDAGHVRRKFYERAKACGVAPEAASPAAIRRARALELMQNNVPLPVVQRILGHSSPNLTTSFVAFSEEDIREVARHFVERENHRKSSARNTFFGKITRIDQGDVQVRVEMVTMEGDVVTTVITNTSLSQMGLKPGMLVTAEIKAPWILVLKFDEEPKCTAENRFQGTVTRIRRGSLITEFIVRVREGTDLCSVASARDGDILDIKEGDRVWAVFNSFSVVLHVD